MDQLQDRALIAIDRRLRHLENEGCDISKMHKFFDIPDRENQKLSISLRKTPDPYAYILQINHKKRDFNLTKNNIKELPCDVNRFISEYLLIDMELEIGMTFPRDYPFSSPSWQILSLNQKCSQYNTLQLVSKYQKQMDCFTNSYCWSPAMFVEKQILHFLAQNFT